MLLNVSPVSVHGHAQLAEVLRTMSADLHADGAYTVAVPRNRYDVDGLLNHPDISAGLAQAIRTFVEVIALGQSKR